MFNKFREYTDFNYSNKAVWFNQYLIRGFTIFFLIAFIVANQGVSKQCPGYQNNDYNLNLNLEKNGILEATEVIKSDLMNNDREEYTKFFKGDGHLKIKINAVTLNGVPISYSLLKIDNDYLLRIKLTKHNINNNDQNILYQIFYRPNYYSCSITPVLILKYQLLGAVSQGKDQELLQFNVLNSPKNIALKNINLTLILPENINSSNTPAEILSYDQKFNLPISYEKNSIQCKFVPDLNNPEYSFLCYLPKNSIDLSKVNFLSFYWLWEYLQPGILLPALTILIFGLQFLSLTPRKKLSDLDQDPNLNLLNTLSPGEIGIIFDGKFDPRDLTAVLIDLACRDYISIHEIQGENLSLMSDKDLILKKTESNQDVEDLKSFELYIYRFLFSQNISQIKFSEIVMSVDNEPIKEITNLIYANLKHLGYITLNNPTKIIRLYNLLAIITLICAGLQPIFTLFATYGIYYETVILNILPSIIGLSLSAAIIFLMAQHLPIRSINGLKVYEQIKHIQDFIINATQEDIIILAQKNPYMFDRLLCIAIALDLEVIWVNKIYTVINTCPKWFIPNKGSNLVTNFKNDFGNTLRLLDFGNKSLFLNASLPKLNLSQDYKSNNVINSDDFNLIN